MDRTAHQTVLSVACNSVSEILEALQTVDKVVRTQDIVLTPRSFRCSRLVRPGEGFDAI